MSHFSIEVSIAFCVEILSFSKWKATPVECGLRQPLQEFSDGPRGNPPRPSKDLAQIAPVERREGDIFPEPMLFGWKQFAHKSRSSPDHPVALEAFQV
ncbi:hypothetical protein [Labrenzia sp. THAF82]|uniref:hypothetical protein n=1 Tax=Labrenzia sp. THAF82 TaxID=2587861 RepID=UPI0012697670|nr:hypothetical protein [Labrenzia sp. THAF82]